MGKALVVALCLIAAAALPADVSSTRVQEDDSRWDCTTMGNHVCGHVGQVAM